MCMRTYTRVRCMSTHNTDIQTLPVTKMQHEVRIAEARSQALDMLHLKADHKLFLFACAKANGDEISERLPEVLHGVTIALTEEDLLLEECSDIQLRSNVTREDVEYCLEACEGVIKSSYDTINDIFKLRLPEDIKLRHIHIVNELSKPYASHSSFNIIEHVQEVIDQAVELTQHLVDMYNRLYTNMYEALHANKWLDDPSQHASSFTDPLDTLNLYISVLAHVMVVFGMDQQNVLNTFRNNLIGIWICMHSVVVDLTTLNPEDTYVVYFPKSHYNANTPLYRQIHEYHH